MASHLRTNLIHLNLPKCENYSERSLQNFSDLFARDKICVLDDPLEKVTIIETYKRAVELHREGSYHPAQIGKGQNKVRQDKVRSDFVHWIDSWEQPPLAAVQALLLDVKSQLRRLYLPVKRWESHFSCYPSGGKYLRHRDRHRKNPNRLVTAVLYLGPWQETDGGQLVIYPPGRDSITIRPERGRMVFFASEFEHEVLTACKKRWSLTTWFRDDIDAKINL